MHSMKLLNCILSLNMLTTTKFDRMAEVLEIFKTREIWHVGGTELLRNRLQKEIIS